MVDRDPGNPYEGKAGFSILEWYLYKMVREAAKKVIFLVARPLRGGPLKKTFFQVLAKSLFFD